MTEYDTNAGGWPDAERPGVPMHPERDGWHWLGNQPKQWSAYLQVWTSRNGYCVPPSIFASCKYGGPYLTPSEIAAREAAAWCAGRDAAADYVDECLAALGAPFGTASVRALTPPADLAAALEAVQREAFRAGWLVNAMPADLAAALEAVQREAFRAGWLVNAIPPEEHEAGADYAWGCEEADWQEYSRARGTEGGA